MCGFAGFLDPDGGLDSGALARRAASMASTLRHRGPDDAGTWVDPRFGVGLGFRRLAIRDLTSSGHQPMESHGGRYVLVFNGEVYGCEAIRARLEAERKAPVWRGTSDTEVLLAAIEAWGLPTALDRADGMFALALWDRKEARLSLARDRLGEKPLYYGTFGRRFLFGSELSALRAHPAFAAVVDRDALRLYFRYGWVPGPRSIHRGAAKVVPGTWVEASADDPGTLRARSYWSLAEVVERGLRDPLRCRREEAAERVEEAVSRSVRERLVSDVPVGLLFSGGVDSSSVAASLPRDSGLRAFTVGFDAPGHDEAPHARAVAAALGLDHTVLRVGAAEAIDALPGLPATWDEPFADPSQLPTALLCALARRHVTVVLTGDGGDELFGGYERHARAADPVWVLRQRLADVRADPRPRLDAVFGLRGPSTAARVHRNALAVWRRDEPPVLGEERAGGPPEPPVRDGLALPLRLMLLDQATYLPDDLLVKIDRASMAVGLEARAPLLAREIVELSWRLPLSAKVSRSETKVALRTRLDRAIPPALRGQPKRGFSPPMDDWLRGPLRDWAENLLDPRRLRDEGFLDAEVVRETWRRHREGTHSLGPRLWCVLAFEGWLERMRERRAAEAAARARSGDGAPEVDSGADSG